MRKIVYEVYMKYIKEIPRAKVYTHTEVVEREKNSEDEIKAVIASQRIVRKVFKIDVESRTSLVLNRGIVKNHGLFLFSPTTREGKICRNRTRKISTSN